MAVAPRTHSAEELPAPALDAKVCGMSSLAGVTGTGIDLERHLREYVEDGVTVLRGITPPELLARLRSSAEDLRVATRALAGPSATRPPGGHVGGRLTIDHPGAADTAPFLEWAELPALRAFLDAALGPDFENDPEGYTMLFEAEDRPIVQAWHRDYRDNVPWLDVDWWRSVMADHRWFCQFNGALYHDVSLWIVPGSHDRDDTPEEAAVLAGNGPAPLPEWVDGAAPEAYELAGERYLASMPGARRVVLAPGDVAVYRDSALHLGHYIPSMRRATLHGHFENDETRRFFERHFPGRPDPGPVEVDAPAR